MANKKYITEKDITSFKAYKIKNKNPENIEEFEKVLENLYSHKYYSNVTEHRKVYSKKKSFKVPVSFNAKQVLSFKIIINSYLQNINDGLSYESLQINNYIIRKKPLRVYKITIIEKEIENIFIPQIVEFMYIDNDVIYVDKFSIKFLKINKKNITINKLIKSKIIIERLMKTPFPLEYQSLNGWMAKKMFKSGFKDYFSDIKTGYFKIFHDLED